MFFFRYVHCTCGNAEPIVSDTNCPYYSEGLSGWHLYVNVSLSDNSRSWVLRGNKLESSYIDMINRYVSNRTILKAVAMLNVLIQTIKTYI